MLGDSHLPEAEPNILLDDIFQAVLGMPAELSTVAAVQRYKLCVHGWQIIIKVVEKSRMHLNGEQSAVSHQLLGKKRFVFLKANG